jgi:predicted transglutaminase-like cysteine proteinase
MERTRYQKILASNLYITPTPWAGWTAFATANPAFPLVTNNADTKITMTPQVMTDLITVNNLVNSSHAYVSDPAGNDNWRILGEGDAGDCEDFALTKAQALLNMGYPASAIHIETGMKDANNRGHAWLVVQTTEGVFALDVIVTSVVINSAIKPTQTTEYFARRRQIGSNWAFISPFGWMFNSRVNDPDHPLHLPVWWYILDPLRNMLHLIPYWHPGYYDSAPNQGFPFGSLMGFPFPISRSISFNFSESLIYVYGGTDLIAFRLNENVLTEVSHTAPMIEGMVKGDGSISPDTSDYGYPPYSSLMMCDVCSKNGYYDMSWIEAVKPDHSGWLFFYDRSTIWKEFGHPYIWDATNWTSSFGETFAEVPGYPIQANMMWSHIDTDGLPFIQAFIVPVAYSTDYYRIYIDAVESSTMVAAVVGQTIDKVLGLCYIPSTDRLNLT